MPLVVLPPLSGLEPWPEIAMLPSAALTAMSVASCALPPDSVTDLRILPDAASIHVTIGRFDSLTLDETATTVLRLLPPPKSNDLQGSPLGTSADHSNALNDDDLSCADGVKRIHLS